jgi:restriction system protein
MKTVKLSGTLVQCKHWKIRKVGVKIARELYDLVASEKADGGILITSGQYTQDAHAFAEKLPLVNDGPKVQRPAGGRRSA